MGLERRSRRNQEFPPQSKSWSLPCIPQEVSILSGCRAAWPPRVGLSLSPQSSREPWPPALTSARAAGSPVPSLLLRNSSPDPCLCLAAVPYTLPKGCPPLLSPPVRALGPEYFLSKHHDITCISTWAETSFRGSVALG